MSGQISIYDYLSTEKSSYRDKYPIPVLPRKYLDEEGWYDKWHYMDEEKPTESDIYYTVRLTDDDGFFYGYSAWANNKWYSWDYWNNYWIDNSDKIVGWVHVPSSYQKDESFLSRVGAMIKEQ